MVPKYGLVIVILALLGVWFFLLRPAYLGGPTSYVMVNGISMEPTMYTGDLALALRQGSYTVGDVVAFKVAEGETKGFRVPQGGGIVIHRIIGGDADGGFITQGDNNDFIDPWDPTPDEIVGKAVIFVPRLGNLVSYIQDPVRISLAVGGLFLYISVAGVLLKPSSRGSQGRRRKLRERVAQRRAGLAAWLS